MRSLFRRKTVAALQAEAESGEKLHRALGPVNLTMLGVGCIIGTGIFVLTGTVAAQNAGPAVVLSFVIAGIASVFAALCYSEFASLVPLSGSAYTYGYATLGEFLAWVIGWDLILEYAVGAITVSIGWSGYVVSLLNTLGIAFPPELAAARGTELIQIPAALAGALRLPPGWHVFTADLGRHMAQLGADPTSLAHVTAAFNLPAVLIVFVVTTLLVVGVKESANFNNGIVFVKLAVILLFIVGAAAAVRTANWHPFIPTNTGVWGHFGWSGVMAGAGIVFFAYIGFDAVSTAAQEAKNPQRDMPIGIIGSLVVCTVLYILVSAVATGVVPYLQLDVPDPIAVAADRAGMGLWMAIAIKLGAIAGLSSVVLVMLYGQSRVFWAMSRDGLLPAFVNHVHPRFRTPWITSIVTAIGVALFAAVFTVREAGSLCSIGTLLAFVIVSAGIMALRLRHPELKPAFRTPAVWFVAPGGALSALYLMVSLPWRTWERLIVWFALGIIIYFGYSIYNSRLAEGKPAGETGWSRALKVVGLAWMILGSLASILWIGRYRETQIAGVAGWLFGIAGLMVALSIGAVLNLLAQLFDHIRARDVPR
ncbi:MAG TPA: amino acid permease [Verrucomicrobiae bacterium]|mgnify:CR=1 FL=1|nr:amino acid permease [Verrucomicrobiae bacterium]